MIVLYLCAQLAVLNAYQCLLYWSRQGCNARKVNCGRVNSAYILKPVLFHWFFYVKDGFQVRLWHPSCVYITAQRQYTAVQKMSTLLILDQEIYRPGTRVFRTWDNYQDYIKIVIKFVCFNKSKNKFSIHWNQCKKGQ